MTIIDAKYANPSLSAVVVQTVEAGAVLVPVDGDDFSGGWRDVYLNWSEDHETEAYSEG